MILTINGGSSSIKFALFQTGTPLQLVFQGAVENIATPKAVFRFQRVSEQEESTLKIVAENHTAAATYLLDWLEQQSGFDSISAIGHRIVFGREHQAPEKITAKLLNELKEISRYDPEHLPEEIKLITLFVAHFPDVVQIACFDTAFHASMPTVAKMMAIPRRYYEQGIHRYGFHGLSYAYLMLELEKLDGPAAQGKIILAQLGSGASLAAVKAGKSMDTTMGFTPASGLPMSTRSGDIDPGLAWYLMAFEKLTATAFNQLINQESGLLGVSETSADMRELERLSATDNRAAEAIELFCYHVKKSIGAYAAVLEGVDSLVFSGGIGAHSSEVRRRICEGLEFLGIELDVKANEKNEMLISNRKSIVKVHVIRTNEELMIATIVKEFI